MPFAWRKQGDQEWVRIIQTIVLSHDSVEASFHDLSADIRGVLVDDTGIEPVTSCVQSRRSPI